MDKPVSVDDLLTQIAAFETKVREAIANSGEEVIDTMTLAMLKWTKEVFEEEKRKRKADQN